MIYKAFLAANTGCGFVSYFADFMATHHTFILKGGPGTGKSTLMKNLAKTAIDSDEDVFLFPCSSDPESLDGVFFPSRGYAVLDGTSPHALDATVPSVNETVVNLLTAVDGQKLTQNEQEIRSLIHQKKRCFGRAYAYLSASHKLNNFIAEEVLTSANGGEARKIADEIYDNVKNSKCSGRKTFFYDSFTPDGLLTGADGFDLGFEKTAVKAGNRYLSAYVVNSVADRLKAFGTPFTAFYSAEWPNLIGQLIVGEKLVTGLCDFGNFDKTYSLSDKPIYDKNAIYLQNLAVKYLNDAREFHKKVEYFYVLSVDFDKIRQIKNQIESAIFA